MDRKIWTTPFGLALTGGSALALIAGYAYGTNGLYVEANAYNSTIALDNAMVPLDENLLIDANREPVTEIPARESGPSSAPPVQPPETESEPPEDSPPEPEQPDEPPVETVNESGND